MVIGSLDLNARSIRLDDAAGLISRLINRRPDRSRAERSPTILAAIALMAALGAWAAPAAAAPVYYNLFNGQGNSTGEAVFDTYATLNDMLNDTNRTGFFRPEGVGGALGARNVVSAGSDGKTYWNLFNRERDSPGGSIFSTYATLNDMLNDTNRTGSFVPDGVGGALGASNVVGSGSDGTTFWNLFNRDLDNGGSIFSTYATLNDMLNDTNRTGSFVPDGGGAADNVVDAGSDGTIYWLLFNGEEDTTRSAIFDTYATLNDMLNDINRTGFFFPDGGGAGRNVVGAGFGFDDGTGGGGGGGSDPGAIPEPITIATLAAPLLLLLARRRPTR